MKHLSLIDKVYKSGTYFLKPLSLKKTYESALNEVEELANANYGTIYLYTQGELQPVYTNSPYTSQLILRKKGAAYKSYREGKLIALTHRYLNNHYPALSKKVRWIVMVPLQNKSRPFGVIALHFVKRKPFIKRKISALKLYGSLVTLAIRKAQLYESVKRALEDRDLFISMASHELKTPLTAISLNNQFIARSIRKDKLPDINWSENIGEQITRITRLINEFLQIKAIKKGELILILKSCGLEDIVKQALHDVKSRYPRHEIIITSKLDKQSDLIRGDHDKLAQAIINLLTNAAKFSPPEEPIRITLEKKQRMFTISIKDHGVGIAKEELPHIFDKFYQSNSRSKGMGIGLYLTKNIIEGHRGEIKVRSHLGKGTEFKINLPQLSYTKTVTTQEIKAQEPTYQENGKKI